MGKKALTKNKLKFAERAMIEVIKSVMIHPERRKYLDSLSKRQLVALRKKHEKESKERYEAWYADFLLRLHTKVEYLPVKPGSVIEVYGTERTA